MRGVSSRVGAWLFFAALTIPTPSVALGAGEGWSYFPGFADPATNGLRVIDPGATGEQVVVVSATGRGVSGSDYHYLATLGGSGDSMAINRASLLPAGARISGSLHRFRRAGHVGDLLAVTVSGGLPTPGKRLLVFGGSPLAIVAETPLANSFSLAAVVDTDGDGRPEIVGTTVLSQWEQVPTILDIDSGEVVWTDPGLTIERIHVGEVGLDQSVMILHRSSGGLVLDAGTREILWQWPDGFNGRVVFGDFLPPLGTREFAVVPEFMGSVKVFRATPAFSPMVEFSAASRYEPLVVDVDGDGHDEIILDSAETGRMAARQPRLNGASLIDYPGPLGSSIRAVDLLGTVATDRKLVFASSGPPPSQGRIGVLGLADGESQGGVSPERGPFHALDVGNVLDLAGQAQVVYVNRGGSSWGFVDLVHLDHGTGSLLASAAIELYQTSSDIGRLDVLMAQLDADPALETIASSSHLWRSDMAAFNGLSIDPHWQSQIQGASGSVGPLLAKDVSGDGVDDVVAIVGGALAFIDGTNGEEIWRSITLNADGMKSLAIGPVAAGGAQGVSVGVGTRVYVFDIAKQAVHRFHELASEVIGQHVEERDGQCFHVLTFSHGLERRSCSSGAVASERSFVAEAVFVGYPGDSFGDVVLGDGSGLMIDRDGAILVERKHIDYELGLGNRGKVLAGSGEVNVFVGGVIGVHRVRLQTGPLFADGFELP